MLEARPRRAPVSDAETTASDNSMYLLVKDGEIAEFNRRKAAGENVDLRNADFRGADLREIDALGIDFSNAYFRGADLRGLDLRQSDLHGASLAQAHISGAYFPEELNAQEILLSVQHGTRMRYRRLS